MACAADNLSVDDPAVLEFVHHPSFRSVASFFLAFVVVLAARHLVHVPLSVCRRIRRVLVGRRRPVPAISTSTEKVQWWLTSTTSLAPAAFPTINSVLSNLTRGLTLCFGLAALAQFGSLLVFSQHELPACAFLVAWSGIATQTAKLLGLLNLSFDLRRLGTRRWESYLVWGLLGAAFVVMFVSNAINVGILRGLPNSSTDAICIRERHIATGAATIAINVLLELYCISRTLYCLVPGFLYPKHKVEALLDIRVARSLSLLALDIATAPQLFVFFGVLADSIPSSLLTVIVLGAFNHHSPSSRTPPTASIPVTRPGSAYSRSTIEIRKMSSTHSLQLTSHPFAARALLDETPESEDWAASAVAAAAAPQFPDPTLIRNVSSSSHRTINNFLAPPAANRRASGQSEADSDVSRSVKNAVLGFAFRRRDSGRGSLSTVPARTAKAELVLLTRPRNPIQSLPMSPITPASQQQPHIEITLAGNDINHPSDDSVPSRASPTPSPRVSDIGLDSNSSSRRGTLSISTTVTSTSGPSSAGLPVSQNRSSSDPRSSLHLTPITPAVPPLSSHRASTDSSEWKYDTYLVPEHDPRRASYASRETEGHSSASSFVVGTATPVSTQQEPLFPGPSTSHTSTQRYSAPPLPPADDDLSIVYEASHEDSDSLIPPSRPAARPTTMTFGQPLPVLTVDFGNTLSDDIGRAERSATRDEAYDGEEVRGIREDMFVVGGIGRAIATPVGVPEDVEGRPRNGSGSGSGSGSYDVSRDNALQRQMQQTGFGNYF